MVSKSEPTQQIRTFAAPLLNETVSVIKRASITALNDDIYKVLIDQAISSLKLTAGADVSHKIVQLVDFASCSLGQRSWEAIIK